MSKQKLEEKLKILRAKEQAYLAVRDHIAPRVNDEKLSPMLRSAFAAAVRMVENCRRMIELAAYNTDLELRRLS